MKLLACVGVCAALLYLGCGEESGSPNRNHFDGVNCQELLEKAYKDNNQSTLDSFFLCWHYNEPQITESEFASLSDTIKAIYNIFEAFFTPDDLDRITGGQHEPFDTPFRYAVVQNSINYQIDTIFKDSISDFRPHAKTTTVPVVLTPYYYQILNDFLVNNDSTDLDRVKFLKEKICFVHHHWVEEWHFASMPNIGGIRLDSSLTKAAVSFRVFYQFGVAELQKVNNTWTLLSSRLTAIE